MAMVIEKLKGQNYNSALSKTDFGDVYKLSIQVITSDLNDILHDYLTCVAPGLLLRSKQTFPDLNPTSTGPNSHANIAASGGCPTIKEICSSYTAV